MSDVDTRGPRVSHARCPFCHDDVRPDDAAKIGCSACMAWHHEPCWTENGGCAACGHDVAPRKPVVAANADAKVDVKVAVKPSARGGWLSGISGGIVLLIALRGVHALIRHNQRDPSKPPTRSETDWRARLAGASTEEQRTAAAREGALAGDPGAMNMLGFRLATGLGCARDPVEALSWGERAAEAGHAEAMYGVAVLLEGGGDGVPRDEARAAAWYRRAVAAGDTMAGPRLDALLRRRPDLR